MKWSRVVTSSFLVLLLLGLLVVTDHPRPEASGIVNPNPGTVTSITAGTGLTGGTITSSGTVALSTPVSLANGGTGNTTGTATVNANLTGPITSVGNATAIASQTGTGTTFVVQTAPTFATSITDPLVIGGTGTTSSLALRSTSGVGAAGADLIFQTGNNGATEAMRILNSGSVGIGTAAPANPLTIAAGNKTGFNIQYDTGANARTGLFAWTTGSSIGAIGGGVEQTTDNIYTARSTAASFIRFVGGETTIYGDTGLTSGSTFTPTARITINTAGNVGIGTTGPSYALDFGGSGSATLLHAGTSAVGVAASPTLRIGGEANGLFSANVGQLNIGTNGIEAIRINSDQSVGIGYITGTSFSGKLVVNGNVGIGTTAPGAKLNVQDSAGASIIVDDGAGRRLRLRGGTASQNVGVFSYSGLALGGSDNTEQVTITNVGNVGIGTTAPLANLHLSVADNTAIDTTNITTNRDFYIANRTGDAAGATARIGFQSGSAGVSGANSLAVIYLVNETLNSTPGALGFATRVGGGNVTEKMRITSSGNVGIGTTSPQSTLDVVKNGAGIQDTFYLTNSQTPAAGVGSQINFNGNGNIRSATIYGSWTGAATTNGSLTFQTRQSNVITTVMTLDNTGNVGIGTASPSRLLHVAGRFQLGGTAIATTDWALTSGWGANATISAVTGTDSRGTVTVTTSALDTPSANPVVTLTFKDGTWTSTPFCMVCMDHASTGPSSVPATCQTTATTLVVSYRGTPTATSALTYKFNFMVVG